MTEDASLTGEQAERLTGALREMDGRSGYTVQYGPGGPAPQKWGRARGRALDR